MNPLPSSSAIVTEQFGGTSFFQKCSTERLPLILFSIAVIAAPCVDKTKEENLAFQKFFQDTGNYIPPEDAESVEQLYERTGEFLKSLEESKKLKDKNLLISTHGAAMTEC